MMVGMTSRISVPAGAAAAGLGDVVDVLRRLVGADPAVRDRDGLAELVAGAQRVRSWLDAFDTRIAGR
jgi:hypothetical protein